MIKVYIPSLNQRSYEFRRGDCQVIHDDKKHCIIIDGGEPDLFKQAVSYCDSIGITHVTAILTHWHYDHDVGLKQLLESKLIVDDIYAPPLDEVKTLTRDDGYAEYQRGKKIIDYAKYLGKPVYYPAANRITTIQVGEIKCEIWRRKANPNDFVDYQVNNTSLQTYFPDLYYLTGGDLINATEYLNMLKGAGKKVVAFKIFHHGNACTNEPCRILKDLGVQFCWYNDFEPTGVGVGGTGFSHYGAYYCKQYFTTVPTTKRLIFEAQKGKLTITYGDDKYVYDIPYKGEYTEEWINTADGWKYQYKDGSYAVGWKKLKWSGGQDWFFFDKNGIMLTGWIQDGKYWYYCAKKTGAMLIGWHRLNWSGGLDRFYFEPVAGKNQGHAYCNEKVIINGETYYFDENCCVRKGWYKETDGYWRYLDLETGRMAVRTTLMIDGMNYRFDEHGRASQGTNPTKAKAQTTDTRTSLNGIDIASYQTNINLSKVPCDFVIIKATQGTNYVNPDMVRAINQAISNNKLIGFYHYGTGSGAENEAVHFVSKIKPYLPKSPAVLAFDWEGKQNSKFGTGKDVAYCKTFLDKVYALTGIKPLIYMSKGICRKYNWKPLVDAGYKLWCAQYANGNKTGYRTNPWTDSYSFGAWNKPTIYQYTSKGVLDGWNGNLDLDLFYGNSDDWKKLGTAVVRQ